MARTKRPNPFHEGKIAELHDKFIRPLIYYKPDDVTYKEWVEDSIFHLKYREITQYKARQDFMLPGLYCETAVRKIQGLGYRMVKRGHYLLVRRDERTPNYEVEFFGGQGNKSLVYSLSESEWNSIAAKLEEVK